MAELLRNLRAMCAVSWQADRARSIGSLLSTAMLPVSRSLQAVGLGLLAAVLLFFFASGAGRSTCSFSRRIAFSFCRLR